MQRKEEDSEDGEVRVKKGDKGKKNGNSIQENQVMDYDC